MSDNNIEQEVVDVKVDQATTEGIDNIDWKDKFIQLNDLFVKQNEQLAKYVDLNNKCNQLLSDFDNYKARTIREKAENDKIAALGMVKTIIPALEDFDRAMKHIESDTNIEHIKAGISLVHKKVWKVLMDKGLSILNPAVGEMFDSEIHEAVTQIPAPTEELKGKIIDTAESGYALSDKIIRFPKVIVGA